MAFVKTQGIWVPQAPALFGFAGVAAAFRTTIIDASAEKIGHLITIPKTGTLAKVGFMFAAVTKGGSTDLKVSFQDVDLTDGDPDGTADQFRVIPNGDIVANTWVTSGLITSDGTDGGTKRSVTLGDYLFVVVEYNTFNGGDSIALQHPRVQDRLYPHGDNYVDLFTASWEKQNDRIGAIALEYDDGSFAFIPSQLPITAFTKDFFGETTEAGMRFKFPFPFKLDGFWVGAEPDENVIYRLYDSDGSTVLASATLDKDVRMFTSVMPFAMRFAEQTLLKDTFYRLVGDSQLGGNNGILNCLVDSAAILDQMDGGQDLHWTQGTPGSWTETLTRRPFMGIIISALDDGVGGGGGAVGRGFLRGVA